MALEFGLWVTMDFPPGKVCLGFVYNGTLGTQYSGIMPTPIRVVKNEVSNVIL